MWEIRMAEAAAAAAASSSASASSAGVPRSEGMMTRSKTAKLREVVKNVIERKDEEERAAPLSTAEDERMIREGEYDAIINENIQIAAGLLVLADESSERDDDRSTDKMIADIVYDMSKLKTKNRAERNKARDEIIHAITNAAKEIRQKKAAEKEEKQRKRAEESAVRVEAIHRMAHGIERGENTGSSVASDIMDERFNEQLNDAKKIVREKRGILLTFIRKVRGDQYEADIRTNQAEEMKEITGILEKLNISESEGRSRNKRSSRIKRINKRNKKTRKHRKTK